MVSAEVELGIDRLQTQYIASLDGKRMKDWLETFSRRADSSYICTAAENEEAGLPVALMLDDNRARIEDRVSLIEKVWAGTFQDYRTRHFIQRLSCKEIAPGHYSAVTNFTVTATLDEVGTSQTLVCGMYEDEIIMEDSAFRFLHKRSIMDTTILPRYIVYPL
jgi:3-phenylpropionate/cinnamic acid dioxygenase small subunit